MPDATVRLKALHINRVAFVSAGDNPGATISIWKAKPELSKTSQFRAKLDAALAGDAPVLTKGRLIERAEGEQAVKVFVAEELAKETSFEDMADRVRGAWRESNSSPFASDNSWVCDVYLDHVVVDKGGEHWSVPYTDANDILSFDTTAAVEVERAWVAVSNAMRESSKRKAGGREEGHVDEPTRKDLPGDLPELVTQYLDSIDKKVEEATTTIVDLTKERDEAKAAAEAAKVEKTEAADENADPVAKAIEAEADPVRKAALVKMQADAKENAEVAKAAKAEADALRVEKADSEAIAKAQEWKHLPLKPEESGVLLRKLRTADPALAQEFEGAMTSVNAVASEAMREFGVSGDLAKGGDAFAKLTKMGEEIAKRENVSSAIGFQKALESEDGAKLYAEYQDAREGAKS